MKKRNAGFTLIELIVTIAILGIVSTLFISSYTDVMRQKRQEADTAVLNDLNSQLNILLTDVAIWDEVVDELAPSSANKVDTLYLTFVCTPYGKQGQFRLADTKIGRGTSGPLLSANMPFLYRGLVDTFGNTIKMESSDHRTGEYIVACKFNSEQLSSVREFTITNDNTQISGEQVWRKAGS